MLNIKILNTGSQPLPQYATPQSAGLDLRADITEPITLKPLDRTLIPTGLHIQLPEGCTALICPRSGLALKQGVTVINAPGIIDADYTGDVGVPLINLSSEPFTIYPGDRIAQMVIAKYEQAVFIPTDSLDQTQRGSGGFGSTGAN